MIRLALLLGMLALPLQAQELPALYKVTGVAADDVLNLRAEPLPGAEVIGTLPPDATGVEVVRLDGNWAVINLPEQQVGYADSQFLAREDGPDWNALERPLNCSGTEPFWAVSINPVDKTMVMTTPDDLEGMPSKILQLWPALPWAKSAAFSVPEGTVVLSPANCSDEMTERAYGIAIDLFLTGPQTTRLSGCCSLVVP